VPFPKEVHLADGGLKLDARRLVIRVSDTMPGRQAAVDLAPVYELQGAFLGKLFCGRGFCGLITMP
jgi:hypothetical protein